MADAAEPSVSYDPNDLDDFDDVGEQVDVARGPKGTSEAAMYAYSTVLSNFLKTPSESLFEYIKAGALRHPGAQEAWLLSVMWCEFDFGCFARNRYGILEQVEKLMSRTLRKARDSDADGDTAGLEESARQALEHAESYLRAKAERARVEQTPTRGLSQQLIQELQKARDIQINAMEAAEELANGLPAEARRLFGLKIYHVYVQGTIAADEAAGIAVSEWDLSEVKERLAKGATPNECGDRMPLSWRTGYDLYLTSLASGDQWRNQGLVSITNGQGFMPPDPGDRKGWKQILAAYRSQSGDAQPRGDHR